VSIVFAKASDVIMAHGYIYVCIRKGTWAMRSRRSGSWALGDFRIGLYIYIYVQDLKAAYKNKTQKLCYTKKITLSLYRYVCMHASYASSTAAHVGSNARAGGWSVPLQFLVQRR